MNGKLLTLLLVGHRRFRVDWVNPKADLTTSAKERWSAEAKDQQRAKAGPKAGLYMEDENRASAATA
jgi:hypothetical protein